MKIIFIIQENNNFVATKSKNLGRKRGLILPINILLDANPKKTSVANA